MTQANPFGGKDLRVKRLSSPTDSAPAFLCIITTKALQKTNEFDDATTGECDTPSAIANRRSVKKQKAWSINISGIADAKAYQVLDADCDSDVPLLYRFEVAKAASDGGGYWQGYIWYENLQINSDAMGVVKFSGQLRGEGPVTWTAAV